MEGAHPWKMPKNSSKLEKLIFDFSSIFSRIFSSLSESSYIPFDRARSALQSCILGVSVHTQNRGGKGQKQSITDVYDHVHNSVFWLNEGVGYRLPKKALCHFVARSILHRIIYYPFLYDRKHGRKLSWNALHWHDLQSFFTIFSTLVYRYFHSIFEEIFVFPTWVLYHSIELELRYKNAHRRSHPFSLSTVPQDPKTQKNMKLMFFSIFIGFFRFFSRF